MSGWTEFKDELNHAKANSPISIFVALVVDVIVFIIAGIVNITQGNTISTFDANVSGIIWFVLAVVTAIGAYFLYKKTMIGYWISLIAMIVSLVIGAVLWAKVVDNNITFTIFPTIIGLANMILLLMPGSRDGLH